jgi:hypothetical protein
MSPSAATRYQLPAICYSRFPLPLKTEPLKTENSCAAAEPYSFWHPKFIIKNSKIKTTHRHFSTVRPAHPTARSIACLRQPIQHPESQSVESRGTSIQRNPKFKIQHPKFASPPPNE